MLVIETLIILSLVLLNGFFAAAEMAVVSARKARLRVLADAGDRSAAHALELIEHPNTFLATVQVGITVVGTLASAFGGARIAEALQTYFDRVSWLRPYSEPLSLGIVVILIAYLSLVLGELAPKRLALLAPETHARRIAGLFLTLSALTRPAVRFLSASSRLVVKLVAGERTADTSITEEEIEAILETGVEEGALEETEQEMLQSVLDLSDLQVRMMMHPRTDIVGVEAGQPVREVLPSLAQSGLSRIPVYQGDLDHIVGILSLRDFIALESAKLDEPAGQFAREALFVAESMPAMRLLEQFKRQHAEMAIVLDEYGGTAGLVTLQDVLERIVGDLSDEYDGTPEPQIRRQAGDAWTMSGRTAIDELKQALDLRQLDGEDYYRFETLAGFLLAHLGRIPQAGDTLTRQGYQFDIVSMDGLQIESVRVTHVVKETLP
jgi:putative hemolysin